MGLREPVHIYDAESHHDTSLVRMYLEDNGIEAFEVDDVSLVGIWMFGFLPGIHRPRVWVDQGNADRAKTLIEEHETGRRERNAKSDSTGDEPIHVVCDECKEVSDFSASKRGTVQDCPHCGAYVDVGEPESFEVDE